MKYLLLLIIAIWFASSSFIRAQTDLDFEDYNGQDIFNNFSGDWNVCIDTNDDSYFEIRKIVRWKQALL